MPHREVEQRWVLTDAEYLPLTARLKEYGFFLINNERPYIEDIYYDRNVGGVYVLKEQGQLHRARLERDAADRNLLPRLPIIVTIKLGIPKEGERSDFSADEFNYQVTSLEDFHRKEADLLREGLDPVLAFIRHRESYQGTVKYGGRGWIVTTEGDEILHYEMQGSIGLDLNDPEGQSRFRRRFSIETAILDRGDFGVAVDMRDDLAKRVGLSDQQIDIRLFFDLILEDALRRGIGKTL